MLYRKIRIALVLFLNNIEYQLEKCSLKGLQETKKILGKRKMSSMKLRHEKMHHQRRIPREFQSHHLIQTGVIFYLKNIQDTFFKCFQYLTIDDSSLLPLATSTQLVDGETENQLGILDKESNSDNDTKMIPGPPRKTPSSRKKEKAIPQHQAPAKLMLG